MQWLQWVVAMAASNQLEESELDGLRMINISVNLKFRDPNRWTSEFGDEPVHQPFVLGVTLLNS